MSYFIAFVPISFSREAALSAQSEDANASQIGQMHIDAALELVKSSATQEDMRRFQAFQQSRL